MLPLDGVYKLVSICQDNEWIPTLKISENIDKTLNPGNKRVWRVYDCRGKATADLITLQGEDITSYSPLELRHPTMATKHRLLEQDDIDHVEKLLVPVIMDGKVVYDKPSIEDMRKVRDTDIDRLDPGVRRIMNPHIYHVSLSKKLWDLKQSLIRKAKENNNVQDSAEHKNQ